MWIRNKDFWGTPHMTDKHESRKENRMRAAAPEMYELLGILCGVKPNDLGSKWDIRGAKHDARALLARIDGEGDG